MGAIFINAVSSKIGGGKNILDNYLEELSRKKLTHNYFVLTPSHSEYCHFDSDKIKILDAHWFFKMNVFFPFLYYWFLPRLLKREKIEAIFNLGDIIIPTKIPQIYFLDWAYVVYSDDFLWNKMGVKDLLTRKVKVHLIKKYIGAIKKVFVQTKTMEIRLNEKLGVKNSIVIPTPIGLEFNDEVIEGSFKLNKDKKNLLFPASFSSHKNFDIIIPVAKRLEKEYPEFNIVITLSATDAEAYLEDIKLSGVNNIMNVGKVDRTLMPSLYEQCDALFFPTLLESYGLPYIEAKFYKKPIITSDFDFSREMCGENSFYFDTFSVDSIIETINSAFQDQNILEEKCKLAFEDVLRIPTWEFVVVRFQEELEHIIK